MSKRTTHIDLLGSSSSSSQSSVQQIDSNTSTQTIDLTPFVITPQHGRAAPSSSQSLINIEIPVLAPRQPQSRTSVRTVTAGTPSSAGQSFSIDILTQPVQQDARPASPVDIAIPVLHEGTEERLSIDISSLSLEDKPEPSINVVQPLSTISIDTNVEKRRTVALEELESIGFHPVLKLKDFNVEPVVKLPTVNVEGESSDRSSVTTVHGQELVLEPSTPEEKALIFGADFDIEKVNAQRTGTRETYYRAPALKSIVSRYSIECEGKQKQHYAEAIQKWYDTRFEK